MLVCAIAAYDKNNVIGYKGALPWVLPEDLSFFKKCTLGNPIIMGRSTWDSLVKKPLPKRRNIVLSRLLTVPPQGAELYSSWQAALDSCQADKQVFFIGGQTVYEAVLHMCDYLFLTEIEGEFEGDAFFPQIELQDWILTWSLSRQSVKGNGLRYTHKIYRSVQSQELPLDYSIY